MTPRAVAVDGIGYGPRAVATGGLWYVIVIIVPAGPTDPNRIVAVVYEVRSAAVALELCYAIVSAALAVSSLVMVVGVENRRSVATEPARAASVPASPHYGPVVMEQRTVSVRRGMAITIKTWQQANDADKDYQVDWSPWLSGDTITSATVTATGTGTIGTGPKAVSNTGTVVTFWISGVALGQTANVSVHIVTAGGRADTRNVQIKGV